VADLETEITELDAMITPLLETTAPELLGVYGVGIDTAAALLVAAGDNPERLRSEARLDARSTAIASRPDPWTMDLAHLYACRQLD
jgi:hypothetical protein